MKPFSDLTVVITTRNRPVYLDSALRSVRAAFGEGAQVIVGDNGDGAKTEALLQRHGHYGLALGHICNPAGSSYTFNLRTLIHACATPWMTLLHDDDFFVGPGSEKLGTALADPRVNFLFSDHWIARNDGSIDQEETERNSLRYGRSHLAEGMVSNLGLLAVENSICLDGFFVRTAIARSVELEMSLPLFAQNRWMIEICDQHAGGYYLKERHFAYRLTSGSLTSQGLKLEELLASLFDTQVSDARCSKALRARIRETWWSAFKSSVKHGRLVSFGHRFSPTRLLFR